MLGKETRESIGIAAVALGLAFAGLEMRQNTPMMRAPTSDSITG